MGSSHALLYVAGDSVTVEMHQQPGDRACRNEAIGGNHYGPALVSYHYFSKFRLTQCTQVYMAAVSDAKTAIGSSANWFKVSQLELVSNNPDYFGSRKLFENSLWGYDMYQNTLGVLNVSLTFRWPPDKCL